MKWFKHDSNFHNSDLFDNLLKEFGHFGPFAYHTLIEICINSLRKKTTESFTEDSFNFKLNKQYVLHKLATKDARLIEFLAFLDKHIGSISETSQQHLAMKWPKLFNLLGSEAKKTRQQPDSNQTSTQKKNNKIEVKIKKDEKVVGMSLSELVIFESAESLILNIPLKNKDLWAKLYPSEEFLNRELLKAFSWYDNNKIKKPKTLKGWVRALSTWFERSWISHIKTIKNQPKTEMSLQEMQSILYKGNI